MANPKAFSLLEWLIVSLILALLASLSLVLINGARIKARDAKRKSEISQLGRFLTLGCYLPDTGSGTYDLSVLLAEMQSKDERYRQAFSSHSWRDPLADKNGPSNYFYQVTDDRRCAIYANLENSSESVELSDLTSITPGGGQGTLASSSPGWNGTNLYYQFSN